MNNLIDQVFRFYLQINPSLAITDSNGNRAIPILWFGDLKAYRESPIRIVTVGINPSDVEFKKDKRDEKFNLDYRFPRSTSINFNSPNHDTYTEVLSNYFRNNPYRTWFDRNEAALNGLGASYYEGKEIRAIHIDIRTPIATAQKWRELTKNEKSAFGAYIPIFNDLIEELQPDIMIMPLGDEHIKNMAAHNITFNPLSTEGLKFCKITLQSKKKCILIKAQNSNIGTYRPAFPKIDDIKQGFSSIKQDLAQKLANQGIYLP